MAGVLKIDIFQVDDNGEKVIDGLNKVYNIEDLDYTVKLLNNENLIPTLIIERLITVNKTSPEHIQVPLEIYKFFNMNNSNLPYTHEDFIKFSVEIHLDELLIYNIPYIFITRGEFGLPNYECKDFADLHDKYTNNQINDFIKETLTYVELKFKNKGYYPDAYYEGLPYFGL